MLASFVAFLKDGEKRKVIDPILLILFVLGGLVCFIMGWVFCALFRRNKDDDLIHPCETLEDIIKREG